MDSSTILSKCAQTSYICCVLLFFVISQKPLPLHQVLRLVRCLKVILYKTLQEDPALLADVKSASSWEMDGKSGTNKSSSYIDVAELRSSYNTMMHQVQQCSMRVVSSVLSDLYARWARRPFSSSVLWEIKVRLIFFYFIH